MIRLAFCRESTPQSLNVARANQAYSEQKKGSEQAKTLIKNKIYTQFLSFVEPADQGVGFRRVGTEIPCTRNWCTVWTYHTNWSCEDIGQLNAATKLPTNHFNCTGK